MKTIKKHILFFLGLLLSTSLWSQKTISGGVVVDHTAQKIVEKVVEQIKKDTPIAFNFAYNIKDEEVGSKKGSGEFLSYNAKYRLTSKDFSHWSDGTTMWNFIKQKNEVEVLDAQDENTMFNFVKIINSSTKNFRPKLIRKEVFNKVQCNVVDLTPNKSSSISKIRLYSSTANNRIQKIEIYTLGGSHYKFTFSSYQAKKQVSTQDFVFPQKSYPNVKIVDLR